MSKTAKIALPIILILLAIGAGTYFFLANDQDSNSSPTPTASPASTMTATPTISPSPSPTPEVPQDWESYDSTRHDLTISHPPDAEVDTTQQGAMTITFLGPTQTQGTEIFDGYSLNIDSGTYSGDFRQFVNSERQALIDEPVTQTVSQLNAETLLGKQAYSYTYTSLGEFTVHFVPVSDTEYLKISILVADPENQDYQQTVDTIIQSIDLSSI